MNSVKVQLARPGNREDASGLPSIETDSLNKRFGMLTAVDNLSFRVDSGEIFGRTQSRTWNASGASPRSLHGIMPDPKEI